MTQSESVKRSVYNSDDSQHISFGAELLRKATHLGALIIPGLYWALDLSKSEALSILIPIALVMTLIDVSRLRKWPLWKNVSAISGPLVRKHEHEGDFTGAFYILWSFCLTFALFDKDVAMMAMTFIIIGDTFAALIGRRFGKHRFRGKSLEGSLACLVGTALVAYGGGILIGFPLWIGLVGAFSATAVEGIPDFIDDNLSVPLLSGLVMTLLLTLI